MIDEDEPPPGGITLLKVVSFLGIVSLGVGVYHGFCNAQGLDVDKENLEFLLKYGPAIVQGTVGAGIGGISGLLFGLEELVHKNEDSHSVLKGPGSVLIGSGITATLGGACSASMAFIETMVGYGLGYTAGYFL